MWPDGEKRHGEERSFNEKRLGRNTEPFPDNSCGLTPIYLETPSSPRISGRGPGVLFAHLVQAYREEGHTVEQEEGPADGSITLGDEAGPLPCLDSLGDAVPKKPLIICNSIFSKK